MKIYRAVLFNDLPRRVISLLNAEDISIDVSIIDAKYLRYKIREFRSDDMLEALEDYEEVLGWMINEGIDAIFLIDD